MFEPIGLGIIRTANHHAGFFQCPRNNIRAHMKSYPDVSAAQSLFEIKANPFAAVFMFHAKRFLINRWDPDLILLRTARATSACRRAGTL